MSLSRSLRRAFAPPCDGMHYGSRQNKNGCARDDERQQDGHVHIAPLVLAPLQHYHEAIERLPASQNHSSHNQRSKSLRFATESASPFPSAGSSGAITTAAATRSPGSSVSSRTPCAGRPDSRIVLRVHADDLSVLADQHDLGLLLHLRDADNFAVALGGLHVDHALAAALAADTRRRECVCRSHFR